MCSKIKTGKIALGTGGLSQVLRVNDGIIVMVPDRQEAHELERCPRQRKSLEADATQRGKRQGA